MAPTPSIDPPPGLAPAQRAALLRVARASIEHGLETGRAATVDPAVHDVSLRLRRASFVTLHRQRSLRGCVGHLEAVGPLVVDVASNAFAAAFCDGRFAPLEAREWPDVTVALSILTRPEPIAFRDEADLLGQLRAGEDGLILEEGACRGTFLPAVWEDLPDPTEFLLHLKRKAGLAPGHWSDRIRVLRYRTESFGEADTV